jgi:parallel beta-helix repeat protein
MSECVGGLRLFRLAGCLILLSVAAPFLSAQNVINVPANQTTIQAAINAANSGDTVLVAPGTYVENINFNGKAITVTSSGGPSVTTIDGGANGSVVTFNTGETNQSILSGFTIQHGSSYYAAGGVQVSSASPTITGNVITGNHATGGIGIYIDGGSPRVTGNTITGNTQIGSGGGGGGIYATAGSGSPSSPTITGNTISNNSVANGGNGGGIAVAYFSSPLIQNNLIQGNTAYNNGGGISVQSYNSPTVVQNVIVNNSVVGSYSGGGLWVDVNNSPETFVNNTIAGNTAPNRTSGLYVTGFGQNATFINNVIVAAVGQVAVTCDSGYSSVSPVFSYNDAFSSSGLNWSGICNTTSNPGNISADPLFLSAADFHIQWGSPVVDAGNNSTPNLPATDFDGNPRVVDGNGDGIAVVDLGAYELAPTTITLAPSSLTFGPQPLGTTSAPQAVTLTNTGNQTLLFAIFVDPNFGQTNNCGSSLAAGASCTINMTFSPTRGMSGYINTSGNLTLKDTAVNSPQTVALAGTVAAPAASFSPASLNFGAQVVGTTSAVQTSTLSNTGTDVMIISGIMSAGDYAQTNNCGTTLAVGASCSISVTFTPTAIGSRPGAITVNDNAPGNPHSVSLTGTGAAPVASLSPTSLAFGGQQIGTTSAVQIITLSNTGSDAMAIAGIASSGGEFVQTNSCGTTLAAGTSCSINVTFTPTATGSRPGLITVTDNASGSPQSIPLTGTGTAPMATLSPVSITFGGQVIGTTSPAQSATLSNTGTAPLTISAITSTGNFAETNNCGTTLAPGASCTINVTFTPAAIGTRSGSVTVTDNASGSPQTVSLTGTGTAPSATLSPASLAFGGQFVGTTSPAQTTTLSNTGNAPLTISAITSTGNFAETNTCGTTLAVGASCSINVTFTPTALGTRAGSVTVSDNASGSPQSVSLTGTGTAPMATLSPTSLIFGSQVIGTTSPAQSATLSNTGTAPLTISAITITGDFAQTNNCGTTLAAATSCTISVTFTPSVTGARTGSLTVSSNSQGGAVSAALSGSGVENAPTFSPTSLAFSSQVVGTKSGGQNIKLTANGPGPLVISSIGVTGQFLESTNCPASLNTGSSCNITINFLPTVGGPATGSVVVTDNSLGSPQAVPLSGNGLDFTLSASPSSVTINAGYNAQYTVTATEVGGSFNNNVNLTCSGLPAQSQCQFSPGGISPKTGSASSTLTIQTKQGGHRTPAGTYVITITGTSGSLNHTTTVNLTVN